MTSVERLVEYTMIAHERLTGIAPSAAWPKRTGRIEVSSLSLRYAPHLDLVIRDASFVIEAGQKIAVVGRTGSALTAFSRAFHC